jgi:PEP-CTERM motif
MLVLLRRALLRFLPLLVAAAHAQSFRVLRSRRVGWTSAIAALVVSLVATPASAQPWTISMTGIIDAGSMFSGGSYNTMYGKSYALSMTVDPSLYAFYEADEGVVFARDGDNPTVVHLTLDGVASTYHITDLTALSGSLLRSFSEYLAQEEALQSVYGRTDDGVAIEAGIRFNSKTNTGLTADFAQRYSNEAIVYDLQSNAQIRVVDGANDFAFDMIDYNPETITINGGPTAVVPEPATIVLMSVGLGLIAVVTRRRATDARRRAVGQ